MSTPPPIPAPPRRFHYLDVWAIPPTTFRLPSTERHEIIQSLIKSSDEPFKPNSLNSPASITFADEVLVLAGLFVILGGPLLWLFGSLIIIVTGSWTARVCVVIVSLGLAYHPLPVRSSEWTQSFLTSRFTIALYKYFTYRFVWTDDVLAKCKAEAPWIGAGPPHGVLPFANILSIPAINTVFGIPFVGGPAAVVFRTPFLRYATLFPMEHIDRESITQTIQAGFSVGLVPDGIAGIFRQSHHREVVALKNRRGLARHALRKGINILPAYSFGNTAILSAWWDPFGMLEYVSRKAQASLFLYWGRFGLPIPRRVQITMAVGEPIVVDKAANEPTLEQVEELHGRILEGIRDTFESHKEALGWGDKELVFD